MNKQIKNLGKKIIVLLLLTSILTLSAQGRVARAAEMDTSVTSAKNVVRWELTDDLEGLDGYYPVILAWNPSRNGLRDNCYFITADGLNDHARTNITEHDDLSIYDQTTTTRYYKLFALAGSAQNTGTIESYGWYVSSNYYKWGYRTYNDVTVGASYFYTERIGCWTIEVRNYNYGREQKGFQLYDTHTYGRDEQDSRPYNSSNKIVCHKGYDSNLWGYTGRFESGAGFWSIYRLGGRSVGILHYRDKSLTNPCWDWFGAKGDYIFCENMGSRDPITDEYPMQHFYMYVGHECTVSVIDNDLYVNRGGILNIDGKRESGLVVLAEGKTIVIPPGSTVIIKGVFWCNGSIENYGTLILDKEAEVYSVGTYRKGAGMINCYGHQTNNDKEKEYASAAWKYTHMNGKQETTAEIRARNDYLNTRSQYYNQNRSGGNFIISSKAKYIQNFQSNRIALLGGAQLINNGSMAVYRGIIARDSNIENHGEIAFGYGMRCNCPPYDIKWKVTTAEFASDYRIFSLAGSTVHENLSLYGAAFSEIPPYSSEACYNVNDGNQSYFKDTMKIYRLYNIGTIEERFVAY